MFIFCKVKLSKYTQFSKYFSIWLEDKIYRYRKEKITKLFDLKEVDKSKIIEDFHIEPKDCSSVIEEFYIELEDFLNDEILHIDKPSSSCVILPEGDEDSLFSLRYPETLKDYI